MPDLRKLTLDDLRKLARKLLGRAADRLRTRAALIEALGERVRARGSGRKPVRGTVARGRGKAATGRRHARRRAALRGPAPRGASVVAAAAHEELDGATDPAGYFVARVRGEDAVREAPHPMAEADSDTGARVPEGVPEPPVRREELGDLPWSYGEDALVALARDPHSLFVYWDQAGPTVQRALQGLEHPRMQLWVFARSEGGWERARAVDVALESRGHYVHELEPGRTYRLELRALGGGGTERLIGPPSNELTLPPFGPSPAVDDRFARLPWDQPLGAPLGPGHRGPGFPAEDREALARLSDWSRTGQAFGGSARASLPVAGGMGGRPTSPGRGQPPPGSVPGGERGER